MKKILLTICLISCSIFLFSQEISFSVGPNWGIPFYYRFVAGDPGKSFKTGLTANFDYEVKNTKKVSGGFGLGVQNCRVDLKPQYLGDESAIISHTENSNVLTAYYKMVFRKRQTSSLSLNPLVGIQLNKTSINSFSNQTGIGFSFSYVKKIVFNESVFLKIEPKFSVYNILPFVSTDLPERFTSVGVNIGLGFRNNVLNPVQ